MYWILYRIKHSVGMYVLDKQHRHDVGFHCFIDFLISSKFLSCFISRGKLFQTFGLTNFMLSVQLKRLCTYAIKKFVCFLNWQDNASLNWKIFSPIWGLMSLNILNISIVEKLIFWWWIETEKSLSRNLIFSSCSLRDGSRTATISKMEHFVKIVDEANSLLFNVACP